MVDSANAQPTERDSLCLIFFDWFWKESFLDWRLRYGFEFRNMEDYYSPQVVIARRQEGLPRLITRNGPTYLGVSLLYPLGCRYLVACVGLHPLTYTKLLTPMSAIVLDDHAIACGNEMCLKSLRMASQRRSYVSTDSSFALFSWKRQRHKMSIFG